MKLRVRVLHARLDPNASQDLASSIGSHGTLTNSSELRLATVELEAPMQVSWKDHEVEQELLEKQIASGVVRPTDLVNDGSGWVTLDAYPPLVEACARAPHHLLPPPEVRAELVWPLFRLTLIAIGVAVVIYIAVQLHH